MNNSALYISTVLCYKISLLPHENVSSVLSAVIAVYVFCKFNIIFKYDVLSNDILSPYMIVGLSNINLIRIFNLSVVTTF